MNLTYDINTVAPHLLNMSHLQSIMLKIIITKFPIAFKSQSGNASLSYIGDDGYLGFSVTDFQTSYGVPCYAYLTTKTTRERYKPVSVSNSNRRIDIQGKHDHLAPFLRDSAFIILILNLKMKS